MNECRQFIALLEITDITSQYTCNINFIRCSDFSIYERILKEFVYIFSKIEIIQSVFVLVELSIQS
jgi:hypothetical protein